ncbi:DEAD/DEAH box helicase [Aporhodopirellula aestuarii]|uniref:DEAD/DEAH box helicase n=1 Tax=Aporhodopirellula aestuarii TaxID=2950107 RepID=A0ABT0U830_9BACT|nr:DEAD/DEAH box helicase [Aporhodopirellula aestuarii]MCM2373036.1 DEAD/DEAH box helicase [Aporhodopirellula aestuarii]
MNRRNTLPSFEELKKLAGFIGRNPQQLRKSLESLGIPVSQLEFEGFAPDVLDDDDDELTLAEQWYDYLEGLYYAAPENLQRESHGFRYRVTEVYSTGEFHGVCTDAKRDYPVFAKASLVEPPAACGCPISQGEAPCPHAVEFVRYLAQELANSRSKLYHRVQTKQFTRGEPSYKEFECDPLQKALGELDLAMQDAGDFDTDTILENDTVARREVVGGNRLAWRIENGKYGLDLFPVSQQPKKRGGGYTKGRRIKLESAVRDRTIHRTDQDRRVLDCVEYEESYYSYRDDTILDPFDAARRLVGAPNVYVDSAQMVVRADELEFELIQVDGHYKMFTLLAGDDEATKQVDREFAVAKYRRRIAGEQFENDVILIASRDGAILQLNLRRNLLSVIDVDAEDIKLIVAMTELPPVPIDQADELLKRLQRIQNRLTIRLPETLLGTIVDVPSIPVVLLRSNSDGSLDVALRIRDAEGRIRYPGASPAISIGQQDGKPTQFRRDVAQELRQSEQLIDKLGLTHMAQNETLETERYAAHIDDFGDVLNVIEQLQSWSTDVSRHREADEMPAPEVLWDRNSEKPVSVLGSISSNNVRVEINRKRNWFGISGQCDVGGKKLELGELLQNLSSEDAGNVHGDFIQLKDGQWARIGEKLRRRLTRLRDATHADRKTMKIDATAAPAIRDFLDEGGIEFKAVKAWNQCLERLARAESLDPKLPKGLDAELRDYQIEGFRWLRRLAEWGVGGVLADDMGLGKTLQTLAVLLDRKQEGPTLVIAPTSVGFNWVREAERFTPGLSVHLYRETDRTEFLKSVGPGDLVVCSYGLALRDSDALAAVEWGSMVLDEAQAIKNSRSKTSKAIAMIPAQWKIALTGTPVENHLGELWSLFHVVSPGVFGGWEQFRKRFASPIEKNNEESARAGLADRLKPFVLRRKKSEVLKDLPPRTEMNLYVDLSKAEREEYERVRLEAIGEVDQLESLVKTQDQRFRILALLTRLRQISCHPKLVNASYEGEAAKLQQLRETLTDLKEEGHRALIFSQFTEHLALIRKELEGAGFSYEYLDGSTPAKERQNRVDAFQNGDADVFLISLKAGGTGLNLTAADYVIHMDPWWNPAVEDQATDRAHRIGQDQPVMVYRIIARGTIEEEILALHETKRDLVAGVMEGTAAAAKLSNDELIAMLKKGV